MHNFRDLGGKRTAGGAWVRAGALYGSSTPAAASERDLAAMVDELGLRTVLDVRTESERRQFGRIRPFVDRLVELPLLDDADVERNYRFPNLGEAYIDLLGRRHVGERLVEILSVLAHDGALPAVVCCSAGKDRTGLVASAVLSALGVPDAPIADAYTATGAALEALYSSWATNPVSTIGERLRTHAHLMYAPREAMVELLDWVRRHYGTFRSYLRRHGATEQLFATLEAALVESG